MPLALIKEIGTGMPDANTYAWVADGDAYHEGHLYATDWTSAVTAKKETALVMATRLLDEMFRWNGFKREDTQALQWPRLACPDPDSASGSIQFINSIQSGYLDETKVPKIIISATCEIARTLLVSDRTAPDDTEGMAGLRIEGALNLTFSKGRKKQPIDEHLRLALGKIGEYLGGGNGPVQLVRV